MREREQDSDNTRSDWCRERETSRTDGDADYEKAVGKDGGGGGNMKREEGAWQRANETRECLKQREIYLRDISKSRHFDTKQ